MGAGSSAEQRGPQDASTAAAESEPASPEAAAAAPLEQPEEPAKILQKNGQISNINGIAEEQVELNLQPGELNGQQAEVAVIDDLQHAAPASGVI